MSRTVAEKKINFKIKNNMKKHSTWKKVISYRQLYLMALPAFIYYVIFHYIPIYGVTVAFKDFSFVHGITGSEWVGLEYFKFMFSGNAFYRVFSNTFILGILKICFGFPIPVIFALLLNEIRHVRFKKMIQTTSYLPHFLSWVILGGMFLQIFSIHGPLNALFEFLGMEKISFLTNPQRFRVLLVATHIWKSMGWNSIIFLAAIASIDTQMYEAAVIDGAGRIKRMIHITLPSILPIIIIMFILSVGNIIKDDFDQIFNLYNPAVYSTADVISTYVYRQGLEQMNFSYAAAVDLFKNIIALILVFTSNTIANKLDDEGYGIW
ncbi:MAG: ABC transporter permease subunit [Firmicutes bacterium]|nr:ABC transporter permease subunit [Bacillota bacterium]